MRRHFGAAARRLIATGAAAVLLGACGTASGGASTSGVGAPGAAVPAGASPRVQQRGVAGADGVLGHDGRWLVDAEGRVVLLHGVNLVAKGTQTPAQEGFGAADVTWLVHHGFDVVRLGLTMSAAMPTPGHLDRSWLASFEGTVHLLTSHGILVLIDLHQDGWGPTLGSDGFPGWMTQTGGATNTHGSFPTYYLDDPAIQAAFQSLWENRTGAGGRPLQSWVASLFTALGSANAADPGVIGYDLLNEPWPGTTYAPCLSAAGCPQLTASELDPYLARTARAVRAVDHRHLLFGEPFVLFDFGTAPTTMALPGGDRNSGMSFHMYAATPAAEPQLLREATAWSATTGGALLDTEFGATTSVSSIDRQVGELDAALIPWIWWSYDEEVVRNLHDPPSPSNTNPGVVTALVRPHPVLVAGTPTDQSYDVATRTLTFTYSTTGPGGTRFGTGTPTEIEVPASTYPDGWRARITGGRAWRHGPPGVLEVVPARGVTSVTVTVAPAG